MVLVAEDIKDLTLVCMDIQVSVQKSDQVPDNGEDAPGEVEGG